MRAQETYYVLDSMHLKKHLKVLASDSLRGRETGKIGQKKAARYIRSNMLENKLIAIDGDKNYYQEFVMSKLAWDSLTFMLGDSTIESLKDYVAPPHPNSSIEIHTDKALFLGYGIDDNRYSDYRGNHVKNKLIIIRQGEPQLPNGNYLITGTDSPSIWTNSIREKLKIAARYDVKAVIFIVDNIRRITAEYSSSIFYHRIIMDSIPQVMEDYPPYVFISHETAAQIFAGRQENIDKALKKAVERRRLRAINLKNLDISLLAQKAIAYVHTENVVGLLQGQEPVEDGYVIVSAHYDHLGKHGETIYHGADDNGSGCATLLTIMEEFKQRIKRGNRPLKSILFLFMTGEEKGLLGSSYYVNNPLLPLEDAYTDINTDMVGRKDKLHEKASYIYVIGSDMISRSLDTLIRKVGEQMPALKLDYRYNDKNDPNRFYYRSDHYNFAKNGIPVVFFFSGVHEDYHKPSDTEDKIMYPALSLRARFIFQVVKAAASRNFPFIIPD